MAYARGGEVGGGIFAGHYSNILPKDLRLECLKGSINTAQ